MLSKNKNGISFSCDSCPDGIETDTDEFDEAMDFLREQGWVARKSGNTWQHLCPACKD